jgi:hypothetical protein
MRCLGLVFLLVCLFGTGLLAQHYWRLPVWPSAFIATVWMVGGIVFGASLVAGERR